MARYYLSCGDLYPISLASSSSLLYPHPCPFLFPAHQHLQPLLLPFPSFLLPSSNPLHCVFSSRTSANTIFHNTNSLLFPFLEPHAGLRPASLLGDDLARSLRPPNLGTPSRTRATSKYAIQPFVFKSRAGLSSRTAASRLLACLTPTAFQCLQGTIAA